MKNRKVKVFFIVKPVTWKILYFTLDATRVARLFLAHLPYNICLFCSKFGKENKWKKYILAREINFELVHIHARFVSKKSNKLHLVKFKHKERSTNFCCIINSNSITFSRGKSKSVTLFQTFLLGRYAISGTPLDSKITSTAIPPAVEPTTIATVATEQGL